MSQSPSKQRVVCQRFLFILIISCLIGIIGIKQNPISLSVYQTYESHNNSNLSKDNIITERYNQFGSNHIIYSNPIHHDQCRNALLYKHNISIQNIINSVIKTCPSCFMEMQNMTLLTENTIWTREYLGFINNEIHNQPFHAKRSYIRFPWIVNASETLLMKRGKKTIIDVINERVVSRNIPIYFMIEKCASSSVVGNLHIYFGEKWHGKQKDVKINFIDEHHTIKTNCGYTFVRDPIHRLISGYYTVSKKIFDHQRSHFLNELKEPKRFTTFVVSMLQNPYNFSVTYPFEHVASQISMVYDVFYGSNISFIGKTEYFDQHWDVLMNHCEWFKQHRVDVNNKNISSKHANKGLGYTNYVQRSDKGKEIYEDMMGFNDYNGTLKPAYYILANHESLYNALVDHYWQDFVCFGYKPGFQEFKQYVLNN